MENITPWVKSFRSSEMRLNLTPAFLWSQWSKLPNVVLLLLSLEKMKYSSIRLNKILINALYTKSCWRHCVWISPPILWRYICYNHLQPLHVGSILQGLALTAWKMAKWQSFTKLEIFRTEEPKNRTSTNACTKAAMPGKWCRDADGRTDTTRHPPLIILK